jgi:hypothetical protein
MPDSRVCDQRAFGEATTDPASSEAGAGASGDGAEPGPISAFGAEAPAAAPATVATA